MAPPVHTRLLRLRWLPLIMAGALAVYLAVLHPWLSNWGATATERQAVLPGDELAPAGAVKYTRALTIDASPGQIWPWLAQIGQDRAGFYSYTWLENLFGSDIHNADRIEPEWQQVEVGDRVPRARQDVFGGSVAGTTTLRIDVFEPGRAIGHVPCVYVLQPLDGTTTRLLCREYNTYNPVVRMLIWDPLHFTVERHQMLGIKARAEAQPIAPSALVIPTRIGWIAAGVTVATLFLWRRERRPWLLLPVAAAMPALWLAHDPDAALAAFLAVGITIVGALMFGRSRWPIYTVIVTVVLLTLLLASDAYVAFGLMFDVILIVAFAGWIVAGHRLPAPPDEGRAVPAA